MGDIDERGDIDLVYECAAESTSTCSTPQSSSLLIIHGTQDGEWRCPLCCYDGLLSYCIYHLLRLLS